MNRFEKFFLALLTLITIQTLLVAQSQASTTESPSDTELMAQFDDDQDGFISLKEAVADARLLRLFSRIDDNADGLLSAQELMKSDYVEIITMSR